MDAVNNLGKDITIIIIAHRTNTLRNCDVIFKLEKGKLIDKGNYNDLLSKKKIYQYSFFLSNTNCLIIG